MSDRQVAVRLRAEVGSYLAGMRQAVAATKDLSKQTLDTAAKHKQAFTTAGLAVGAFGAAAGVGIGAAVKTFASFDQEMSAVQAATHASASAMNQLRDAALEAGARTVFSASEAGDAIEALAKAGVSTRDILGGGLNGALDLAAAGTLAVGDAAEIAATALTQFGLSGGQVPHVADLLAAGAGKAQGEVSDMGMALKQAGLVADQTGLSIEETTAGLSAFASAGLIGSDAGTSFKSMLQRLTPQSDEAADLMKQLGISAYDTQGNFVGLEKFAGNLQTSLAGLTAEQRNSALATIFGSDAVRAAAVLYDQGAQGIADWTKKVDDAGYAQETAAIKLDNLKGDVEAFSGSIETAFIKTGSAGNGVAREVVQAATSMVNAYSDLPGAAQTATLGMGGVIAASSAAAGGFLILAPRISETRKALDTLSTEMPRTTAAMRGLGKASAIAAVVTTTALAIDALRDSMTDAPPKVGALTDSLSDFVTRGRLTGEAASLLGDDFSHLAGKIALANKTKYLSLSDYGPSGGSNIERARRQLDALDQTLTGLVQGGHGADAAEIFAAMSSAARNGGASIGELEKAFPGYTDAVKAANAETKLGADPQKQLGAAAAGAARNLDQEKKSLSDLEKELRDVTGLVLGLRDAQRGYEAALDDVDAARVKNGRTLDEHTAKGRENAASLDAVAKSGNDVLQAMIDSGRPYADVTKKLQEQRAALAAAARGFGASKSEARQYADMVLRIPKNVQTRITLDVTAKVRVAVVNGINTAAGAAAKQDRDTRADGGWIAGPGGPRDDLVPIAASNGEFIVNARSAANNAALLEAINGGRRFADGGWVSGPRTSAGGMSDGLVRDLISAVKNARPVNVSAVTREGVTAGQIGDELVFLSLAGVV